MMTSSTTTILNYNAHMVPSFASEHYYTPSNFAITTPAPSPNLLSRRKRLSPPSLKKRKHCDNNYTPSTTSLSILPIKTNLPYLNFGDDNDDEQDDANQTTSGNSLVFPSLPKITLKKRTNRGSGRSCCSFSSSPNDIYLKEEEELRKQPQPQEEEGEEVTQEQDCELEEPAARRMRTSAAPSSFTTYYHQCRRREYSFKPISIKTTNHNSNSNSISNMTHSVSLQFSFRLMNVSELWTPPKRNSVLHLSKSLPILPLDLLNGTSGGGSGRDIVDGQ